MVRLMDFAASPFEIKSLNEAGHIEGLLAGFGNVDSYGDRIAPQAFNSTLAAREGRPLPMLLHHDAQRPIGTWREWHVRGEGLYTKGLITLATRDGQEAYALAKDGVLTGLSIGYLTKSERKDPVTGANDLLEIELFEGSLVTFPANPKTQVAAVKSIQGVRDIAELLQLAGMSSRKAKLAAGAAWKAIHQAEDDDAAQAVLSGALARLSNL